MAKQEKYDENLTVSKETDTEVEKKKMKYIILKMFLQKKKSMIQKDVMQHLEIMKQKMEFV